MRGQPDAGGGSLRLLPNRLEARRIRARRQEDPGAFETDEVFERTVLGDADLHEQLRQQTIGIFVPTHDRVCLSEVSHQLRPERVVVGQKRVRP